MHEFARAYIVYMYIHMYTLCSFISPQKGRQGLRSPWGGQIGGAGVDKHGSAGVTLSMPKIEFKDGSRSPDSVSTLEYHIG